MRSLCSILILAASRHILRIRRNRAAWRSAFVGQLRMSLRVLAASALLTAFCVIGGAL